MARRGTGANERDLMCPAMNNPTLRTVSSLTLDSLPATLLIYAYCHLLIHRLLPQEYKHREIRCLVETAVIHLTSTRTASWRRLHDKT